VRIAMWSGPRTISTAMMRAWGSRADTVVVDEPFYAFYLHRTGLEHPGRAEVLASQPVDPDRVLAELTGAALPPGRCISYQKQMAHHLLAEVDRGPLSLLRHAFLIRDPAALVASYARVRAEPTLADLGLEQQRDLWRAFGGPVVDAGDVLARPEPTLRALCAALGVGFDPAMLSWAPGPRPEDGVWAPHWYDSVWRSTGFRPAATTAAAELPGRLAPLLARCRPLYEELAEHRLAGAA
jgi:hypothetical protein